MAPYDLRLRVSADYGAVAALITRGAHAVRLDRPLAIRRCDPDSLSERETRVRLADFVRVQRETLAKGWPEVGVNLDPAGAGVPRLPDSGGHAEAASGSDGDIYAR